MRAHLLSKPDRIRGRAGSGVALAVETTLRDGLVDVRQRDAERTDAGLELPVLVESQVGPASGGLAHLRPIERGGGDPDASREQRREQARKHLTRAPDRTPHGPVPEALARRAVGGARAGSAAQARHLELELPGQQQVVAVEELQELAARGPPARLARRAGAGVVLTQRADPGRLGADELLDR
ncbi:MAG: hypothetical protein H6Q03_2659, partial [Acidobacteria bacterium]|nr:hypothetical protein [Acidobacteriota bacterium]